MIIMITMIIKNYSKMIVNTIFNQVVIAMSIFTMA